jgi:cytochrome c553
LAAWRWLAGVLVLVWLANQAAGQLPATSPSPAVPGAAAGAASDSPAAKEGASGVRAASEEVAFFEKKIRPVLATHCYECHSTQATKVQGKLRVDTAEGLRQGGESGPAVVPGDPDRSLLVQALRYEHLEMPPKGKLPPEVIADFEQWIRAGAVDPREGSGLASAAASPTIDWEAARRFWAFQPPVAAVVPERPGDAWSRQPLDRFILARLDAAGLSPAEEADRRTWLRRVTFDLTGLPPTPEEVERFEVDTAPDARERVVDRLLASPHFGERLARLWLDVARYAEDQAHIVGKDESLFYPNAYLYRDWVIEALNRDLPYDQFLRLQLAADLLEGEDSPNLPALGFLGLGPKYYSRRSLAVMADEWEDRVDVVARGLLGLTVACARCHDHKYDPIQTEDYYALAGVFASTAMYNRPLSPDVETADANQKDGKEFENGKKLVGEAKDPKQAMHIVREGTPTDLNVFIRGNVENRGPLVPRRFLRILCAGAPQPFVSGSGRRELAEAITDPANPLVARVMVNRLWGLIFGRPLVATASNFGSLGERPTHPELLDTLAVELMARGWSLKSLLRQYVLSATYAQSSRAAPAALATDADNRLLSHMPRRRLTVEQWRDAVLAASGWLEASVGGRSIDPLDPQQRRRTVYSRASRLELNRLLALFDYPDPNVHADRRVETISPLQKLFVLNSPLMVAQAQALAERLCREVPAEETDADRQRIECAWRLLYARPPRPEEVQLALAYLAQEASLIQTQHKPLATPNPGAEADGATTKGSCPGPEAADVSRWTRLAQVLLAANEMMYLD